MSNTNIGRGFRWIMILLVISWSVYTVKKYFASPKDQFTEVDFQTCGVLNQFTEYFASNFRDQIHGSQMNDFRSALIAASRQYGLVAEFVQSDTKILISQSPEDWKEYWEIGAGDRILAAAILSESKKFTKMWIFTNNRNGYIVYINSVATSVPRPKNAFVFTREDLEKLVKNAK